MGNGQRQGTMEAVEWFRPVDYEILDYLHQYEIAADHPFETRPLLVSRRLEKGKNYVASEMSLLENAGILDRPHKGVYRLSDLGRRIVENNIDRGDIPDSPR